MLVNSSEEYYSISKFLESYPPNNFAKIEDLKDNLFFRPPIIKLHCDECNGMRNFKSNNSFHLTNNLNEIYIRYTCSNCDKTIKIYSLLIIPSAESIYKFGEYPTFGSPTPTKLMNILGSERETFLKGRRCENQGLGIGAFTYYRRVVENQKNKLIEEIIKVSMKLSISDEKITQLKLALSETQFTNAINIAKDSIPESLFINGYNPLLLLYRALSEGVHNLTDEKCLELAQDIRIVLGELATRLSQALKDDAQLIDAISRLTKI